MEMVVFQVILACYIFVFYTVSVYTTHLLKLKGHMTTQSVNRPLLLAFTKQSYLKSKHDHSSLKCQGTEVQNSFLNLGRALDDRQQNSDIAIVDQAIWSINQMKLVHVKITTQSVEAMHHKWRLLVVCWPCFLIIIRQISGILFTVLFFTMQ